VVIGNTGGENPQVFEVWAVGEAPRGMSTLAKSLSLDMRARDRQYLRQKLESLAKTSGDVEPWDMQMPNGSVQSMPSEVAAFAQIVLWECDRLGMFENISDTPLVDAMMSKREPKTTPDGTMSWTVDVKNPMTEDDFKMFLTEAVLPNGQQRPISLWLAGKYPRSLDGLCKALSHDMRVMPISWLLRKLDQLDDTDEVLGDFRAQVPGSEKTKQYPSTVAYLSALIKHRLSVLRLIPGEGQEGVRPQLRLVGGHDAPMVKVAEPYGMLDCPSCNERGTVKVDGGCPVCTACSWSKCQ
jgi:ribonucleoside-diphosphate reductase alpha chain